MTPPLILRCHAREAEPWPIDTEADLADAIAELSEQYASDAGSDELEENTEECRELYRADLATRAQYCLRVPGDSWRGPDGVRYTLEIRGDD